MERTYKRNIFSNFLKQIIFITILVVLFLGINNIYIQAQSDDFKYEKGKN